MSSTTSSPGQIVTHHPLEFTSPAITHHDSDHPHVTHDPQVEVATRPTRFQAGITLMDDAGNMDDAGIIDDAGRNDGFEPAALHASRANGLAGFVCIPWET